MNVESKELFTCKVCDKKFTTAGRLSSHEKRTNVHDGIRQNAKNEIFFACGVCDKEYCNAKQLTKHRYNKKHTLSRSPKEPVVDKIKPVVDKIKWMEMPTVVDENIYLSDGHIRNEISHEKERVIELSTSLALDNVQEGLKRAFRSVREEMIPLYVAAGVERMDAWERIHKVLAPFENELIMMLMTDLMNL